MKLLRFLLFPFAVIYDLVTRIRNFLFDVGFFKQTTFPIPVIVVGNLSLGGTGKSPQIEYLIRLLKNKYRIAILSRGYKRQTKGFLRLNNSHSAVEVGDEPLQFFKKFNDIFVAVDANRVEGIQKILHQNPTDIVLLDDAFQHRKVKGSFYILLTKFEELFTNDFLLPTGNLRESRREAKRASVIIVTKCPEYLNKVQQEKIKKNLKFYSDHVFFTNISYEKNISGNRQIPVDDLKNYEVLLLTGIANPDSLLDFLYSKKITFQHLNYSDHHHFTESDVKRIQSKFETLNSENKIILTTEKDFVRLNSSINDCYFLGIQTNFLANQKEEFDSLVISHITSFSV